MSLKTILPKFHQNHLEDRFANDNPLTREGLLPNNATGRPKRTSGYECVAATIALTVYGQLIIKWQMRDEVIPSGITNKLVFFLTQFTNPWIFTGFAAALIAGLFWMAAMAKLPISRAYPLMSLAFVAVTVASAIFLNEPLTTPKLAGMLLLIPSLLLIAS